MLLLVCGVRRAERASDRWSSLPGRKKAGSRMRRKAAWMQENAGLQLRGLTRRFGAVVAVDGVDLDIPAGQMLGVIGRSGAGKSTLLRMINRLQEPSSGTIRFGQTDVTALRGRALRDWRAACAMIFQQFNLVPRLDVLTNALIGRLNHRGTLPSLFGVFNAAERAMALQALERFDLLDTALQR